ncbi:hypothetical protein PMAYCL1PPCAC_06902, partial [Pristionchus mayeri]
EYSFPPLLPNYIFLSASLTYSLLLNFGLMALKEEDRLICELECYRRTLFIAVTLSTSAVISSAIFVPLVFSHLQSLQTSLSHELHFCTTRSHDLWDELREVERSVGAKSRIKRQNFLPTDPNPITYPYLRRSGGAYQSTTTSPSSHSYARERNHYVDESSIRRNPVTVRPIIQFPSICIFGIPGPRGFQGPDGLPGPDGLIGRPGIPAADYDNRAVLSEVTFCQQCAPALQGTPGLPGPKGYPGMPGLNGHSYYSNRINPPGLPGLAGSKGLPGLPGMTGVRGMPGTLYGEEIEFGPPGPPGLPGAMGTPGTSGSPGMLRYGLRGDPGIPGKPGQPGQPGGKGGLGPRGFIGARGSCDHCPTPQLAPGYR